MGGKIKEIVVDGIAIKYRLEELPETVRWLKQGDVYLVNEYHINLFPNEIVSELTQNRSSCPD